QIAQSERLRRTIRKIRFRHAIEAASTEHTAKAGKILGKAKKYSKPILAVIDFQTLEGSKEIVRLDNFRSDRAHRTSVGRHGTHVLGRRQRRHHRARHAALQAQQLHTAVAKEALARNRFAFRASS